MTHDASCRTLVHKKTYLLSHQIIELAKYIIATA